MKEEEENLKHAILRFQRRKEEREGGRGSTIGNKQTKRHTNKQKKSKKEGRVGWLAPNKQTN